MLNIQPKNKKKSSHTKPNSFALAPQPSLLKRQSKPKVWRYLRLRSWITRLSLFFVGLVFVFCLDRSAAALSSSPLLERFSVTSPITSPESSPVTSAKTQSSNIGLNSSFIHTSNTPKLSSPEAPKNSLQPSQKTIDAATCSYNGIPLYGKVEVVTSFPDLKVKKVDSFPDLNVQWVTSFPDNCGQWEEVTAFPDFTIQYVDSFPDLEVKEVDSFPGIP